MDRFLKFGAKTWVLIGIYESYECKNKEENMFDVFTNTV